MNKSEQSVVDTFETSSAMHKDEVLEGAAELVTQAQARQAYLSLITKGILAEDDYGIVTLSRKRLAEYDDLYPLLDAPDEDF